MIFIFQIQNLTIIDYFKVYPVISIVSSAVNSDQSVWLCNKLHSVLVPFSDQDTITSSNDRKNNHSITFLIYIYNKTGICMHNSDLPLLRSSAYLQQCIYYSRSQSVHLISSKMYFFASPLYVQSNKKHKISHL